MNKKRVIDGLVWVLAALLFMAPAFYNGYPLVFSDTGTYIASGFDGNIPVDRPIWYGWFIRIVGFKSLWFVLFVQSMILAGILRDFTKLLWEQMSHVGFLMLVGGLVAFTGVGWYTSQIMPDIFTAICLLLIPLLTLSGKISIRQLIFWSILFVFSMNVHFSNLFIVALILLLFFGVSKVWRLSKRVRYWPVIGLMVISIFTSLVTNYVIDGKWQLSKGGHVFLMGRMLDNGVLKSFLDDKCGEQTYVLCGVKDSLPKDSRAFLWDGNSPLAQNGGWVDSKVEYNRILTGILTSPKHLGMFLYKSGTASMSQLFQNDIGSGLASKWYSSPSSPPYQQIKTHYGHEFKEYIQSRQNGNLWGQRLDFTFLNHLNYLLLVLSSMVILSFWFVPSLGVLDSQKLAIGLFLLLGILSNAVITASLANVYDRLQARVSWLLVFYALLLVWNELKRVEPRDD